MQKNNTVEAVAYFESKLNALSVIGYRCTRLLLTSLHGLLSYFMVGSVGYSDTVRWQHTNIVSISTTRLSRNPFDLICTRSKEKISQNRKTIRICKTHQHRRYRINTSIAKHPVDVSDPVMGYKRVLICRLNFVLFTDGAA